MPAGPVKRIKKIARGLGPWGIGLILTLAGVLVASIAARTQSQPVPLPPEASILLPVPACASLPEQNPLNPVLLDEAQVAAFRETCLHAVTGASGAGMTPFAPELEAPGLFLRFTAREEGDRTFLIQGTRIRISKEVPAGMDGLVLQCIKQAVIRSQQELKDLTGLPVPPGLLYAWIVQDASVLRQMWGLGPRVGAATLLSRYVVVPIGTYQVYAPGRASPFTGPSFRAMRSDLVHELTHALFRCSWARQDLFVPAWFMEGMAVTAAKQGSGEVSDEYVRHGRAFRWLRARAGTESVRTFVQGIARGLDFQLWLYRTFGVWDEQAIEERMARQDALRLAEMLGALVGLFLLVRLRASMRRRRPVPDGEAPDCHRVPLDEERQTRIE